MSLRAPDLVFFDFGGVVAHFAPEQRLARMAAASARGPRQIQREVWDSGFARACDAGAYAPAEMYARLRALLRTELPDARLRELLVSAFEPQRDVLVFARRLRARMRVGLLSNNGPALREALCDRFSELAGVFDPILLSCELGACKPDPRVFERAAQEAGLPAAALLLVDDEPANVAAARAAGWQALHYTSLPELAAVLEG